MPDPKEAALLYALRGWHVIPMHSITEDGICSCGQLGDYTGNPPHAQGKHPYPEHGHKDSSSDASQILLWWEIWPEANVAIVTGAKSKLVVLDLDAKSGGYESLTTLERRHGVLPKTVTAKSGGGGKHYYFKHPGFEIRGRRAMKPGLDVMADGGKIVAPPSKHKSGTRYFWIEGLSPDDLEPATMPRWLLSEITTKRAPVKRRRKLFPWMYS